MKEEQDPAHANTDLGHKKEGSFKVFPSIKERNNALENIYLQ